MHCSVTTLRYQGQRLKRSEWPLPVTGHLHIGVISGADTYFRRPINRAEIRVPSGSLWRSTLVLFDPQIQQTTEDGGLLISGIELLSGLQGGGMTEVHQLWMVYAVQLAPEAPQLRRASSLPMSGFVEAGETADV
jgi:hypothetical protein